MKNKVVLILMALVTMTLQAADRPNFIFILTDDQQVGLLGCEGNKIVNTPNIDQLAKDGIHFDNAHITSAICTPSRISILLSQFERKHGVNFNSGTSVAKEAWKESYPMVMRDHGYYTGYVGKNHAPIGKGGYQSGLMDKSFDYWYAGHGHLSFYPKKRHKIFKGANSHTQIEVIEEGVNDFFTNEHRLEGAMHFIDSRPNEQPFCLSVCFNLPHGSSTGTMKLLDEDPEIYKSLYRDLEIPLPSLYVAKEDIKEPKLPLEIHWPEERQTGYDYVDNPKDCKERLTRQMQAVTGIDQMIGRLRTQLKEQGLDKNTIIFYTSDHGLFMGEFGLGGKALCYEVTTHVPFFVYNPMAPKKAKGKKLDNLVQSIDIAPTMLDYAGIDIPNAFQGKSIKPIIEGALESEVRDYLFTENLWSTQFGNPRCESVQNKEWKYIRYYKNENLRASKKKEAAQLVGMNVNQMFYAQHDPDIATYRGFIENPINGEQAIYEELYNLTNDPQELTNLASDANYSETLNTMRSAWKKEIIAARGEEKPKVSRYTKDSMLEGKEALELH
ncbi:sulfatase-like hydrolase/transferase [Bacteroidales bacterium]|nr:sulfatase-like hydrolase/transferase [Bacteroidales bacterium]